MIVNLNVYYNNVNLQLYYNYVQRMTTIIATIPPTCTHYVGRITTMYKVNHRPT